MKLKCGRPGLNDVGTKPLNHCKISSSGSANMILRGSVEAMLKDWKRYVFWSGASGVEEDPWRVWTVDLDD